MPRYIDANDLKAVIQANDWSNPVVPDVVCLIIDRSPTADVAPKSEFDRVYNELEHLKMSVLPTMRIDLQMANTRVYEADAEVERLERICNSYALQYGTVTDQQKVIDKAKAEIAREIFEEMQSCLIQRHWNGLDIISFEFDAVKYAELKKKYTEEENGR